LELDRRHLNEWLERGYHGEMAYLSAAPDRARPAELLTSARTLIVVAMAYGAQAGLVALRKKDGPALTGTIARYALGHDYHLIIKRKLNLMADAIATLIGRPVLARACVDTAPLLERAYAVLAGLGFAAKSTMTIVPGIGSNVLLGELLVDVDLPPGEPIAPGCGSCRACLDACPTGAFVDAHVLDARRCISYLTIELTGPIPRALRALVGTRVFGCDVCQDVCPYNAGAGAQAAAKELVPRPELSQMDLVELLKLSASSYRRLVKQSALSRASRARLARNAAVALGNTRDRRAIAPLLETLEAHPSALVRGHCAWALGRLADLDPSPVRIGLDSARRDRDPFVREEADLAIAELGDRGGS
jgi:epoxyqueuosine reductase